MCISCCHKSGPCSTPSPSSEDETSPLPEETSLNDAVLEIAQALGAGHLKKAIRVLQAALESFHGAEVMELL